MKNPVLIHQGNRTCKVTVPKDGVPFISHASGYHRDFDDMGIVINFLRCGCPAVQFLYEKEFLTRIQSFLAKIALPGETFRVAIDKKKLPNEARVVMLITRTRNRMTSR